MTKKYQTENKSWKGNFKVTKHRNRTNGCDYCKQDVPTQGFVGFNGDALWICGECFKKLITP